MTFRYLALAVGVLTVGMAPSVHGQWILTGPRVESFDDFRGTGLSAAPSAGELDSNAWRVVPSEDPFAVDRATAFGAETNVGELARGTSAGGVATGGVYAFNAASPGPGYALGVQPSGTTFGPMGGSIRLRVANGGTTPIVSLRVSYTVYTYNDGARDTSVTLATSDDDAATPYVDVDGSTFTTPSDATNAWTSTPLSFDVPVTIEAGEYYYLRWTFIDGGNGTGSRDEVAIDDVSITPTFAAQTPIRLVDGVPYTESFDLFRASGVSTMPATGDLDSRAFRLLPSQSYPSSGTMFGDVLAGTSVNARGVSSDPVVAGGIYAFVVASSPDNYALGIQPSGSNYTQDGAIVARAQNDTTRSNLSVRVTYAVLVRNDQDRSTSVLLGWSLNDAPDDYTDVESSRVVTNGPLGSSEWVRVQRSVDIDVSLAPSALLYLRWSIADVAGTGSRDEVAIDDLHISVLPESDPDAGIADAAVMDASDLIDAAADAASLADASLDDAAFMDASDLTDAATADSGVSLDSGPPDASEDSAVPTSPSDGSVEDAQVTESDSGLPSTGDSGPAGDSAVDAPDGKRLAKGCGCATVGHSSASSSALGALGTLLALLAMGRRRRARH